jgi:hypothetical protein
LQVVGFIVFCLFGLSGDWVIVAPAVDHPLLAAIEMATGIGPDRFMTAMERANYLEATVVERRHQAEVDRLYDRERQSRWQGEELTADDIRRMGSMQQTLTEMGRGERFVMDYLRTRGRERERWYVGLPLAVEFGFSRRHDCRRVRRRSGHATAARSPASRAVTERDAQAEAGYRRVNWLCRTTDLTMSVQPCGANPRARFSRRSGT